MTYRVIYHLHKGSTACMNCPTGSLSLKLKGGQEHARNDLPGHSPFLRGSESMLITTSDPHHGHTPGVLPVYTRGSESMPAVP